MKKALASIVLVTGILFFALGALVESSWAGETYQCTKSVDAYSLKDPTQQVGSFAAQTTLEIGEYVESAKMFRVLYKGKDGSEMEVYCKPDDLGRKPPAETPRPGFTGVGGGDKPKTSGSVEADPREPPFFGSLRQFQRDVWETEASKFALQQSSFGFAWVSQTENNESRWGPRPGQELLKFLGRPLYEAIVRFKSERPEEVRMLVFNRGDAKQDLDEMDFTSLMKGLETSLDQWVGTKGVEAWIAGNVAGTKRKSWFKFPLRVDLESSTTRSATEREEGVEVRKGFRVEFVRLVLTPYDGKMEITKLVKPNFQAPQVTVAKNKDLKEHIKKEDNGDVYLDGIPMVDQGMKGYCVVAASERVLRYFGLDVDQNEIAKLANTSSSGTDPESMYKALSKICRQFSLNVRELMSLEFKEFLKEVNDYNRVAKKNKKREIVLPQQGMISLNEIWDNMDLDCLREVRLKRANEKTKFTNEIVTAVDKGVPLLWSVEVGWVEETPALPQARGGHMRLIIGYNKKTNEIFYTDTWGAGHELKKMKLDDAFFITNGLFSVAPTS
jgi:hypothetical protein